MKTMNRDDDFPSEGINFSIKQLMIKHFESCVNKTIVKCVDKGVFDNDEINALEIVAQEITSDNILTFLSSFIFSL